MSGPHDMPVLLAIAPTSRGFGYIVFENGNVPSDWGVKSGREHKNRECLRKARKLLQGLYPAPSVLVLEEAEHVRSRRAKRIKMLIEKIGALARERGIRVVQYSREDVLRVFGGEQSKHDVAETVTMVVPALAQRLPPRRRVWESEHYSMAIFEAAALVQTHLALGQSESQPYSCVKRATGAETPAFHAAPISGAAREKEQSWKQRSDRTGGYSR